jgi:hypothetical protein
MANYRYSTREVNNNKYNNITIMTIKKVNTQRQLGSGKEKITSKYIAVKTIAC